MQAPTPAADDSDEDSHARVPWIPGCANEDEDQWGDGEGGNWDPKFEEFDEWDDDWRDAGMEFVRQLAEREDSDNLTDGQRVITSGRNSRRRGSEVAGPSAASTGAYGNEPAQTCVGTPSTASGTASSPDDNEAGEVGAAAMDVADEAHAPLPPEVAAVQARAATAMAAAAAAQQLQGAAGGAVNVAAPAPNGGQGPAPPPQTTFRVKVWQDESKYIGEWVGDRMNGVGEMRWADGRRYLGEWLDNRCHGRGVLTYQDGRRYEGEYTADMMHGKGEYHWSEGARYVGEYREHKKHGRGVMTWKTGGRYDGEYVDDKMTGHGMMTWADGRRYEGEWLEGRCTGMGTTSFKSGSRYVGSYSCDKMEGRGCYTFADGRRYEGEYKSNQKHGRGVYKWGNGLLFSGTWAKGAPKQGVLLFRGGACARTVAARSDLCPDVALQKLQDEARAWVEKEVNGGPAPRGQSAEAAAPSKEEGAPGGEGGGEAGAGAAGAGAEGDKKSAGWTVRRADARGEKEGGEGKKEGGSSWSLQALLRSTWRRRASTGRGREESEEEGGAAGGGRRGSGRRGGGGAWGGRWWRPRLVKEEEGGGEGWLELREGELWHFFVGHEEEEGRRAEGHGGARLLEAAGRGLLDVVMWFVNAGWAQVTYAGPDGRTALHAACRGRHVDVASFLLAMGADPGAVDAEGRRCLWSACASGDGGMARVVAGACSEEDVVAATGDLFGLAGMQSPVVGGDEAAQRAAREAAREAVLEVWRRWSGSEGLLDALAEKEGLWGALVEAAGAEREATRSAAGSLVLALGQRGAGCLALLQEAARRGGGEPACIQELVEQTRRLELGGAEVAEVASSVGQLAQLQELSVTDTVVQRLPPELAQAQALRSLTVRGGCLSELPEAVASLSALTALDASSNVLVSLPSSFASLPLLATINLSRNRLRALPAGLGGLHSLSVLCVEENLLRGWPRDLEQCSALSRLEAGGNEGLGLPPAAHRLSSLRTLSLAGNQLSSLAGSPPRDERGAAQAEQEEVALPEKALRELNLSHNCFKAIPDTVVRCRGLERVWLSHNELTAIPASLAGTRGLRTLHVDHNRIRLLPPALSRTALMGTYDLRVEGNEMRHPMRLDSKLDCPVEELLGYCSALERGRERVVQATVVVEGPARADTKLGVVDCFVSQGGTKREGSYGLQALRSLVGEKWKRGEQGGGMEAVVVEHSRVRQAVDGEGVELQFVVASGSREAGHEAMRAELVPGRGLLCFVWEARAPLFEVLAAAREALGRFLQGGKGSGEGWSSEMAVLLACVAGQQGGQGAPTSQPAEVLRFFCEQAEAARTPAESARPASGGRGAAAAAAFDRYCGRKEEASGGPQDGRAQFKVRGFLTVDASLKHCAWVPIPGQEGGGVRGVRTGEVVERLAEMGRDAAVGDYAFPEAMAPQGLINAVEIIGEMAQQRAKGGAEARGKGGQALEGAEGCGDGGGEAGEPVVSSKVLRGVVEDQCGLAWEEYGGEVLTILKARGIAKVLGGGGEAQGGQADADGKVLLGARWVGMAAGLVLGLRVMGEVQDWRAVVRAGREMLRAAGWGAAGPVKKEVEKKVVEASAGRLAAADPDGGMLCKGVLVEGVGEALFGSAQGGGAWGAGMPGWELVGAVLSSFGVLIREEVSKTFLLPALCTNAIPYPLEWVRSTGAEGRREWIAWRRAGMGGEARRYACFQVLAGLAQRESARLVLWRDGGLVSTGGGKLIVDGGVESGVLWLRAAGEDGIGEGLVQAGMAEMRRLGLTAGAEADERKEEAAEGEPELSVAAVEAARMLDEDGSSEEGAAEAAGAEPLPEAGEQQGEGEGVAGESEASAASSGGVGGGAAEAGGEASAAPAADSGGEREEEQAEGRAVMEGEGEASDGGEQQPLGKDEATAALLATEDGPTLDIGPGPHPAGCGPTEQASPA